MIFLFSLGKYQYTLQMYSIGNNLNVMRQSVLTQLSWLITMLLSLIARTWASETMVAPTYSYYIYLVGAGASCLMLGPMGSECFFLCSGIR